MTKQKERVYGSFAEYQLFHPRAQCADQLRQEMSPEEFGRVLAQEYGDAIRAVIAAFCTQQKKHEKDHS